MAGWKNLVDGLGSTMIASVLIIMIQRVIRDLPKQQNTSETILGRLNDQADLDMKRLGNLEENRWNIEWCCCGPHDKCWP